MKTPTSPFWQAILDECDRLKEELECYRARALESESRAHLLERELADVRTDLKKELLTRTFRRE